MLNMWIVDGSLVAHSLCSPHFSSWYDWPSRTQAPLVIASIVSIHDIEVNLNELSLRLCKFLTWKFKGTPWQPTHQQLLHLEIWIFRHSHWASSHCSRLKWKMLRAYFKPQRLLPYYRSFGNLFSPAKVEELKSLIWGHARLSFLYFTEATL